MSTPGAAYMQAYKLKSAGRVCECGRPATVWMYGGFICQTCVDLNKWYTQTNCGHIKREIIVPDEERKVGKIEGKWAGEHEGFQKTEAIGWGSLTVLEEKLRRIAA